MRENPDLFEWEWFPPSLCSTGVEELALLGAVAGGAGAAAPAAAVAAPAAAGGIGTLGVLGLGATALSAGATILGTQNQAEAATRSADAQARALELKAAADKAQASNEAGYYQRQALIERRKTNLALSRSQALAAAEGGDTTDPTVVDLQEGIAQQGQYNILSAIAAGKTREATLNEQANIDLFNADRYRQAGPLAARGALYSGVGSLAGLAGTTADRYYRYKLPLAGATA